MRVLTTRNAHQVLPSAIALLLREGQYRHSRNGDVLVAPWPVVTEYTQPLERVVLWPERDANPFFHLYESLWMLAGRNDLAPLLKFVKTFGDFSDDGLTLWGAYGHRWRLAFEYDQLLLIAKRLRENPDDRRCVLQMWKPEIDLVDAGKDHPCNLTATFQRGINGKLDLTVFCRSNDIVWGAYGANCVHFAFLLEYMAAWIGCPVGMYQQISVNWHAYPKTLKPILGLAQKNQFNPYDQMRVLPLNEGLGDQPFSTIDRNIHMLLRQVDTDFTSPLEDNLLPFFGMAYWVLRAHCAWRTQSASNRFTEAFALLQHAPQDVDWAVAARQWFERRAWKFV